MCIAPVISGTIDIPDNGPSWGWPYLVDGVYTLGYQQPSHVWWVMCWCVSLCVCTFTHMHSKVYEDVRPFCVWYVAVG